MRLSIVNDVGLSRPFGLVDSVSGRLLARHVSYADAAWHMSVLLSGEVRDADTYGAPVAYCTGCGDLFASGDVNDADLCQQCADEDPDDDDDAQDDEPDESYARAWGVPAWMN